MQVKEGLISKMALNLIYILLSDCFTLQILVSVFFEMVCFAQVKKGPVHTSRIITPLLLFFVDIKTQNITYAATE